MKVSTNSMEDRKGCFGELQLPLTKSVQGGIVDDWEAGRTELLGIKEGFFSLQT